MVSRSASCTPKSFSHFSPITMFTSSNSKNAIRNRRWRAIHSAKVQSMTDQVNAMRAEMGLGSVSTKFTHSCPFKGGKRPHYEPPAKLLATMTKEQLSLWKKEERRKRKAAMQRENRKRKAAMVEGLEKELSKAKKSESKSVAKSAVRKEPNQPALLVQVKEPATPLSNETDKTLLADPYESNTDTASWIGDEVEMLPSDELVHAFDVPAEVVGTSGLHEVIQDVSFADDEVSLFSDLDFKE